ncbi:MAG TPA: hypothetical protein VN922_17855, partial [Bacteroidia bacterium]|nr:hypothetical protein [Bacteroidia bacterium]
MNTTTIRKTLQYLFVLCIFLATQSAKGQTWTALGTGLNGNAYSVCVYNGNLYAAGAFTTAGGVTSNNIAEWNGTTWDSVGHGLNDTVYSLCVYKGNLYAGGAFTKAGFVTANHIAMWNGTTWANIGLGVNNNVYSMQVFDSLKTSGQQLLYVGGSFTTAGGKAISYLAVLGNTRWDSVRRTAFDDKNQQGPNNVVRAMNIDPSKEIDIAGNFSQVSGVGWPDFAQFDATQWFDYNSEPMNSKGVLALASFGGNEYLGGNAFFTTPKTGYIGYINYADSNKWTTLGSGVNNTVYNLTTFNSDLY